MSSQESRDRGVSEIIGLVLLFGMVTAGVALVLVTSSAVQSDAQQQGRLETAELALEEVDSRLATLAYRSDANLTDINFPNRKNGDMSVEEKSTTITFKLNGKNACSAEVHLGAIRYDDENGGAVVYESGGIYRISDGTPVMASQPDLNYQGGSINFNAKTIRGGIYGLDSVFASKDFQASKRKTDEIEQALLTPDGPSPGNSPCTPRESLTIRVESERYHEMWEQTLKQEFPDQVTEFKNTRQNVVEVKIEKGAFGAGLDSDNDGVPDGTQSDPIDNCRRTYNPKQRDVDGDGNGGPCDGDDDGDGVPDYVTDSNGDPVDDDGDGEPDRKDNCQKLPNGGQKNRDGDELGDPCDPDDDGDGRATRGKQGYWVTGEQAGEAVYNAWFDVSHFESDQDACQFMYSPAPVNTDGKGKPDTCDKDDDNDNVTRNGVTVGYDWRKGKRGPREVPPEQFDGCPKTPNPDHRNLDSFGGDPQSDPGRRENACDPDVDGDGYWDKLPGKYGSDPKKFKAEDNCDRAFNPNQNDNPCNNDFDGDGVKLNQDNCPTEKNRDQKNYDKDELDGRNNPRGDKCDPDDDGDGVNETGTDALDNCPETYNPKTGGEQPNTDSGDETDEGRPARGDACDPDVDGDTYPDKDPRQYPDYEGQLKRNERDNCPTKPNPGQADGDGDGVGDKCDQEPGDLPSVDGDFATVQDVDAEGYRDVSVSLSIDPSVDVGRQLVTGNFTVYEDGNERDVKSVEGTGSSKVDVVFVVDETSEMGTNIASLQSNIEGFVNDLNGAGVDARYALVSFKDSTTVEQSLTGDSEAFIGAVNGLSAAGGGDKKDDGVDAIHRAATLDFREDARPVVIHVSTGKAHQSLGRNDHSPGNVADKLDSAGAAFYTISPPSVDNRNSGVGKILGNVRDGTYMNIESESGLGPFLDEISPDLKSQYVITFDSCRAADGDDRQLDVYVDIGNGRTARATTEYSVDGPEDGTCQSYETPSPGKVWPDRAKATPPAFEPEGPPGRDAHRASDRTFESERPKVCKTNDVPDYENIKDDYDPLELWRSNQFPNSCYPTPVPDFSPGEVPDPFSNVINIGVDVITVGDGDDN